MPTEGARRDRLFDQVLRVAPGYGDYQSRTDIATADPRRFTAELDRMARELTAHLDYEEAWLLPVLARIPFPPAAPAQATGS
ncbi:hypothetical protein [Streptomyces silvisoli]|uniref:hypothetical protein n=1 Tax=Streptomyces silvisoli TaxID=3034235 RepID=UPI0037045F34